VDRKAAIYLIARVCARARHNAFAIARRGLTVSKARDQVGRCGARKEARPKQESVHTKGMRSDNNAAHAEPGYARCFALLGAGRKWRDGPVNVSSAAGRGERSASPRAGRTRGIRVHVMHSIYRSSPFYRTLLIKRRDPERRNNPTRGAERVGGEGVGGGGTLRGGCEPRAQARGDEKHESAGRPSARNRAESAIMRVCTRINRRLNYRESIERGQRFRLREKEREREERHV